MFLLWSCSLRGSLSWTANQIKDCILCKVGTFHIQSKLKGGGGRGEEGRGGWINGSNKRW